MLPTEQIPITIDQTALPFMLHWMTGHEELGRVFEYQLEIYSEKQEVAFDAILGKPMTVCVTKIGGVRFFNGIVTRLGRIGFNGRHLVLRATLSPKLWLLGKTTDCRIYQGQTVPQVLKAVLKEHAISVVDELHGGPYEPWDYLTQYRESDLAFISRIMEREGIYYYFKHTQTTHEIVLSDSPTSHSVRPKYDQIPIWASGNSRISRDHFTGWRMANEVTSIGVTLQAHDYRLRAGANIAGVAGTAPEHEQDEFQLYDYAGQYVGAQNKKDADDGAIRTQGDHYASVQLDEQRSDLERIEAEGNLLGLETGATFQFDDLAAPTDPMLVVATQYDIRNLAFETSSGTSGERENCHVTCSAIKLKRQFRPARITPRPLAIGPETAIVVGPKGTEIHTDLLGRVRIQFHWDREGLRNESSTCWVRVSQIWAGASWGAQFIPRHGHEVVVQFLGGDPDRPIVTGSVYNADNLPPYTVATQSGIRSHSSKGGTTSNCNEIRFEDKKGGEELFVQAEHTHTVKVKGSRSLSVGGSETITIGDTRTTTVTKKDTHKLHDELHMTVDGLTTQYFKNGHIQDVYGADQELYVQMKKDDYVTQQYKMESAEEILIKVGESEISIKPDKIEIKAVQVLINGSAMVDVKGGIIKLNSP